MRATIRQLYDKIFSHDEIRRLMGNATWLTIDRIIRLGINLIVIGWMARYLGPEKNGIYDYAFSITSIVGILAVFGSVNIVVREIINKKERVNEILGTVSLIMFGGGIVVVAICYIVVLIINADSILIQKLVVIISTTYLFTAFDVIDLYFQARIQSKYVVIARNLAFFLLSGVRILLIIYKAPLEAFAVASVVEIIAAEAGMIIMYYYTGNSISRWRWNTGIAKQILRDSWPLMLAYFSSILYFRIDQVMIPQIIGYKELGIYSAAVKISEVWYFVPAVINSTIYPKVIESKKLGEEIYYNRLQKYFTFMVFISYLAILPTFLLKGVIINLVFGAEFAGAATILGIHIWGGLFQAMGFARNSWCNTENLTKKILVTTFVGTVINIVLNLLLIKPFGGVGAAFANIAARIFSMYLMTMYMSTRIFAMQTKSLLLKGLGRMIKHADFT